MKVQYYYNNYFENKAINVYTRNKLDVLKSIQISIILCNSLLIFRESHYIERC